MYNFKPIYSFLPPFFSSSVPRENNRLKTFAIKLFTLYRWTDAKTVLAYAVKLNSFFLIDGIVQIFSSRDLTTAVCVCGEKQKVNSLKVVEFSKLL